MSPDYAESTCGESDLTSSPTLVVDFDASNPWMAEYHDSEDQLRIGIENLIKAAANLPRVRLAQNPDVGVCGLGTFITPEGEEFSQIKLECETFRLVIDLAAAGGIFQSRAEMFGDIHAAARTLALIVLSEGAFEYDLLGDWKLSN